MAYVNTGKRSFKVLEQFYTDNNQLVGTKMPNIQQISPQAIVPNSANITFNYPTDGPVSGGSNGDIIYNAASDNLYKNINGSWVLLTDRVNNDAYIAPVDNFGACPLPV